MEKWGKKQRKMRQLTGLQNEKVIILHILKGCISVTHIYTPNNDKQEVKVAMTWKLHLPNIAESNADANWKGDWTYQRVVRKLRWEGSKYAYVLIY